MNGQKEDTPPQQYAQFYLSAKIFIQHNAKHERNISTPKPMSSARSRTDRKAARNFERKQIM